MSDSLVRELGLLRALATHLDRRPLPPEGLTQGYLRREGLGHVREDVDDMIVIRMPGHHAFTELTECILDRVPRMERGVVYADVQTELFACVEDYIGREASSVDGRDAQALIVHFEKWFADSALPRRVFVPCVISRTPAPHFEIGPVKFEYIDDVTASSFYPRGADDTIVDRHGFDDIVRWMREEDANWLAHVSVEGCERKRAEEIAELSVDLVIVGLQLAAPYLDTRTMSRLDARRGTSQKRTLSEAGGFNCTGWTRREPGLAIGHGTLPDILEKAASIFAAVGNVVRSFSAGSYRLPTLERAWCDAAYWFHQALAESIDTIAIAKLETVLEVLVCAESSKGSERRMFEILNAFFGLGPDDQIAPGSLLTTRQFARNVVRDRSRILHGTWSTLNARGIDREGMEGFVATVLRTAVIDLEAYCASPGRTDNIEDFLGWVGQRRVASELSQVQSPD